MAGTLYIVATPIGNLEDLTSRALRILREVDLIACEDTRHTRKLLDHYGVNKHTISYHEHNEIERTEDLTARLLGGSNVAIVSDAGTPLIADPGYRIVQRASREGIAIVSVPGPSALVTALAGSGLATDSFYFGSFLPPKQGQRQKTLQKLKEMECTLVFYEAPQRLIETLQDVAEVMGERDVVVCRELTKIHEEWVRGRASEVRRNFAERPAVKGEITLLIAKAGEPIAVERSPQEAFDAFIQSGMSRMDAMKAVARERGLSKREIYSVLQGGATQD